jgi:putative NADPH-quinone reductase
MRQVRNSSSYPEPNAPVADRADVTEAIRAALEVIKVAEKVVPVMPVYGR